MNVPEEAKVVAKTEPKPASPRPSLREQLERFTTGPAPLVGLAVYLLVLVFVGVRFGLPSAVLGLAALALLVVIWQSFSTVTAMIDPDDALEDLLAQLPKSPAALRKESALRALMDLEHERDIGNVDHADYEQLLGQYRAAAKEAMRALDEEQKDKRKAAEKLIEKHLLVAKDYRTGDRGRSPELPPQSQPPTKTTGETTGTQLTCATCETKNDLDARFLQKVRLAAGRSLVSRRRVTSALIVVFAILGPTVALALPAPSASPSASASATTPGVATSPSITPSASSSLSASGSPSVLPSGAPSASVSASVAGSASSAVGAPSAAASSANPHAGAPVGPPPLPQDESTDDPRLPPGSIFVQIFSAAEKPVPGTLVTLRVDKLSIAEGDSSSTKTATTNDAGFVRFDGLSKGTGTAYRVSVTESSPDGNLKATYGVPKFTLPFDKGWGVVIHKFPVSTIHSGIAMGVDTVLDVSDDAITISHQIEFQNDAPLTWGLGKGLTIPLPKGAKALRQGEAEEDFTVSSLDENGVVSARWLGSLGPGSRLLSYDFKIPYEGESEVEIDLNLPPQVLAARVRIPARKGVRLEVDGFDPAKEEPSRTGVRILSVVKGIEPGSTGTLSKLKVHIRGLPERGSGRYIAIGIGLLLAVLGLTLGPRFGKQADKKVLALAKARRRRELLDDVKFLHEAHARGDVGQKTFDRERARLVEAIAQLA